MLYLSNLYYSKSNFDETIIKNQHEQEHMMQMITELSLNYS